MLNILTTPENKKFCFIVPDDAQIDKKGFYIIDDNFKLINSHINFDYLAHDLNFRGLVANESFYGRKDYMAGKVNHIDYYLQLCDIESMKRSLLIYFGEARLKNSKDKHFNDIALREWDIFNARQYINNKYCFAQAETFQGFAELWESRRFIFSAADNVCLGKAVASVLRDELKEKELKKSHFVKVTFDNGDIIKTSINGNHQSISDYYAIGKVFNLGNGPHDLMARVDKLEFLS